MKKLVFITTLFFGCFLMSHAQNEQNIWYFGKKAGIDFNTSPPTALSNSAMNRDMGTSTISDASGNLLFYTDGNDFWDRTHQLMLGSNGSILTYPGWACQASIIVKQPGFSDIYYVFSHAGAEYYSIVDMSKNAGLGEVTVIGVPFGLSTNGQKMTAISHKYCGVWIITESNAHPLGEFYAYHLTSSGLNTTPVISPGPDGSHQFGILRPSPDGKKLLSCGAGSLGAEIYDFDNATGLAGNSFLLQSPAAVAGAFSSNGDVLYLTTSGSPDGVYQFDLSLGSAAAINASKILFGIQGAQSTVRPWSDVVLGPDDKIYIARVGEKKISVINNPNAVGPGANYVVDGFKLANGTVSRNGLPNFTLYLPYVTLTVSLGNDTSMCQTNYVLDANTPGATYLWQDGSTDSIFNVSQSGNYDVEVTVGGCSASDTINVIVNSSITSNQTLSLCTGQSVTVGSNTYTTTGIYNDTLIGGSVAGCDSIVVTDLIISPPITGSQTLVECAGFSIIVGTNTYTSTGVYNDVLTTANGCDSIVTTDLTVAPSITSNQTLSICTGQSVTVGNNTYTTTGIYNDTLIGGSFAGCDSIVTTDLTINPSDVASFNYTSATYCDTDLNPLPTITGSTGGTFTIDNLGSISTTTGEIDLSASGVGSYVVTYTTTGICPDTVSITINITNCAMPIAGYTVSDDTICAGACISFTDQSSGVNAWQWTFNGGTPNTSTDQNPSNICFDQSGTYIIEQIVSNGNATDTATSTVVVNATPTINAGVDVTIDLGQSTGLNATGTSGSYNWTPPTWLSCVTCVDPIATPEETITYTVTVVDSNGCTSSDTVKVIVDYDLVIFIPNIFSPNGDGNNDILYVEGVGISTLQFLIYNRWGEKVFETQSMDQGWDGTFRGEKMNKGVFVYYLKATFIDGQEVEQKGDITLIR